MAIDHTFSTVNANPCQYSIDLLAAASLIHKNTMLGDIKITCNLTHWATWLGYWQKHLEPVKCSCDIVIIIRMIYI